MCPSSQGDGNEIHQLGSAHKPLLAENIGSALKHVIWTSPPTRAVRVVQFHIPVRCKCEDNVLRDATSH
eukprot:3189298-Amphidinium_carterae.1